MSATGLDKLDAAKRIASVLAERAAVSAVCLYGSVARGDATDASDIDMLVVGDRTVLSNRTVRAMVPPELEPLRPAITAYSFGELERLFQARASFAHHVVTEGRILFDRTGELTRLFRAYAERPIVVDNEIQYQLRRLEGLSDTRRFNDNFLFGLAQLYAIGKAIVMLRLSGMGASDYNKDRAFESLARRRPELRPALHVVADLKPFYMQVTRRQDDRYPYSYHRADRELRAAIDAIKKIAASA